ncbi:MAG: class I SAM-dependent methyltransferase [Burkholderiales bacterium]
MTDPATYARWYDSPRGAWIGGIEAALLDELVAPGAYESVLDVGCGTGYFTSYFAQRAIGPVVGLDPNLEWLDYAASHAPRRIAWVAGRGEALPFAARSFDVTVSVTALCFIADQEKALREIVRVTRRRIVLGLLNRRSLLWWQKGRGGGSGAYRGAHWHTVEEARELLSKAALRNVRLRTAIFFPGGGAAARWLETRLPRRLPFGAFLAAVGDI